MEGLVVFAIIAGIIGIIGSIAPGLPGPPISWIGILLAYLAKNDPANEISSTALTIWLIVTVAVTILDYIVPAKLTTMTGGSKTASRGALVGMFAGIFFTPIGMLSGSLLGAFLAELLVENKPTSDALKAALGAFLGFLVGTGMKLICSCTMMYHIVIAL